MKVIIAGSRTITDYSLIEKAIKESGFEIDEIVSGGARGVDTLAEQYAKENDVTFTKFDAQWGLYGNGAGLVRNRNMAEYADALIDIWDGVSRGSRHMIFVAKIKGLKVFILKVNNE